MSSELSLNPGMQLGPYTLGEVLGTGASATVFLATREGYKPQAIKVRRSGQRELDRRFLREFESMRLLRVPGVVQVHEAGMEGRFLWFTMDRVFGTPFPVATLFAMPVEDRVRAVLDLARKLCTILASLHEAGFVHRDIKPNNVMVDDDWDVHVLDFGIGRYFGDQTLSLTGEVLGTVPYMAPEQLAGLPTNERADLFATGLMLHEAVNGPRPRPATTVGWIPRICLQRSPPLACMGPQVPRGFSALVAALLAVDPCDRPTARKAALALQSIQNGDDSSEWPVPEFVDPGGDWSNIEGCIGAGKTPVWVLEGPYGSGRRRLAEQMHRVALLQGTWTINLHCRVERVGGPLRQLIERLITDLDDALLAVLIGDAAPALRQMWPHLPLPMPVTDVDPPTRGRIGQAIVDVVQRASKERALLLVFHQLEQVDPFTARVLPLLTDSAGDDLGLLLLHETRWATATSTELVGQLVRDYQAGVHVASRVSPEVADAIALRICPQDPPTFDRPTYPQSAVEAAYRALARIRGEPFVSPDSSVWPVTILERPIPLRVYTALTHPGAHEGPWVRWTEGGIALAGPTAVALARCRLAELGRSASMLAAAFEARGGPDDGYGALATLLLLAGEMGRAWEPAARAAVRSEQHERYPEARDWLMLIDTLPQPGLQPRAGPGTSGRDAALDFEIAMVRARVSLHTDAHTVRPTLVDSVEVLAHTEAQEFHTRLLRIEYQLRMGEGRTALVGALRIGSAASGAPPPLQVAALLLAVRCRLQLGQLEEGKRDLDRAEALVRDHQLGVSGPERSAADAVLDVRVNNARAEIALVQQELLWCRAICQQNIRVASQQGYVRGIAEAAHRLARVLRMLGRRREAEHQVRSAREAVAATGDAVLDAETGLTLATLLVERGDVLPARHLLDATLRKIHGLSLHHLVPAGLRLMLQIATAAGDPTDASVALAAPAIDPEMAAARVRWWRTRGDMQQALSVPPPAEPAVASPSEATGYGTVLWRIERGRATATMGDGGADGVDAGADLELAIDGATELEFAELQTYALLVFGLCFPIEDDAWGELQRRAARSMYTEVFLGALEMDARRLTAVDPNQAALRWRTLLARSRELGYQPGVVEAEGWLTEG